MSVKLHGDEQFVRIPGICFFSFEVPQALIKALKSGDESGTAMAALQAFTDCASLLVTLLAERPVADVESLLEATPEVITKPLTDFQLARSS